MSLVLSRHYLRLGSHAEKRYFVDMDGTYDAIIINANLVQVTTAASGSLLLGLSQDHGKPFLVDPWTYVFGLDPNLLKKEVVLPDEETVDGEPLTELKVKAAYQGLAAEYHPLLLRKVGKEALVPDDFTSALVEELSANVCRFQMHKLTEAFQGDDLFGYVGQLRPQALIAPYFLTPSVPAGVPEGEDDRWLGINVRLLQATIQGQTQEPVLAMVCIPSSLLADGEAIERLAKEYTAQSGVSGYLIWVSDADETALGEPLLRGLVRLVRGLGATGAPVANMYGGYFSVLMTRLGLHGYSHAVAYGESRSVNPVIGGLPAARYYFPPLHQRLLPNDFAFIAAGAVANADDWFARVCGCPACREVIGHDLLRNYKLFVEPKQNAKPQTGRRNPASNRPHLPTADAMDRIRRHYLFARFAEDQLVRSASLSDLRTQLVEARRGYGNVVGQSLMYLSDWAKVVGKAASD